jgi:hypothetical protein
VEVPERDVTARCNGWSKMMGTLTVIRNLAALLAIGLGLGAVGCTTGQKHVRTPRYLLSYPDFWDLKAEGQQDGQPTKLVIAQYGSAIIDQGSGTMAPKEQNYDAVQADVDARIYAWPAPEGNFEPTKAAHRLLFKEADLKLANHAVIAEQPVECGKLKKKYKILGVDQEPLDLVSRPGWRTIVVGGKGNGSLVGVVARVEFEQDVGRFCHNLDNMQVQLQNLLDGLTTDGGAAPASTAGSAPPVGAATTPTGK